MADTALEDVPLEIPGTFEVDMGDGTTRRMTVDEMRKIQMHEATAVRNSVVDQLESVPIPKTDEELWHAVYRLTGYQIPRVAVCENHVAPFQVFADMFFGRSADVLCIGNRGGGKTTISGFLHGAKCRYFPGFKAAIAGSAEKQSQRAYAEFKRFIRQIEDEIVDTLQSKTLWVNDSETEVLGGTVKALNGPHPHLAQFDEVELTERIVFEEFQNMAQGDTTHDAQNLLTSTRKRPGGMVQELVDEVEEAEASGHSPPWEVAVFCIFETIENVPNCGNGCGCEKVVKGKWQDGTPRTFASVCDGRAGRAHGFVKLGDVHKRFRRLSRATWEAQQECLRPNPEGLVHDWFDPEQDGILKWFPRPEYGPVYRSWDWGGTNPHAVLWHQMVHVPVDLEYTFQGNRYERHVPEGTLVTFDELYYTGGSFRTLGLKVFERTQEWADHGFDFDIERDFADPAGRTPKEDVKDAARDGEWPVPRFRSIPATLEESVDKHIEWGEGGRILINLRNCPNLIGEFKVYSWPEDKPNRNRATKPVDKDNHACDAQRYAIWNIYRMDKTSGSGEVPGTDADSEHPTRRRSRDRTASPLEDTPISDHRRADYVRQNPGSIEAPSIRRETPKMGRIR